MDRQSINASHLKWAWRIKVAGKTRGEARRAKAVRAPSTNLETVDACPTQARIIPRIVSVMPTLTYTASLVRVVTVGSIASTMAAGIWNTMPRWVSMRCCHRAIITLAHPSAPKAWSFVTAISQTDVFPSFPRVVLGRRREDQRSHSSSLEKGETLFLKKEKKR